MMIKKMLQKLNVASAVVLAIIALLMINYIALRNPIRSDWSKNNYYEVSEKTRLLLENLDQPVRAVVFFQHEHELYEDIRNLFAEYQYLSGGQLEVEWVDPLRDVARAEKLARKYNLTEAQVVVFEANGRNKVVRQVELSEFKMIKGYREPVLSGFKGEQAFSSAIQGLMQGSRPKVYFLVGHGERRVSDFDQRAGYSSIGMAVNQDNVEVDELMLSAENTIPEDTAALIIPSPQKMLSQAELEMIEEYLNRSGRVMVLLDAMTQTGLEELLLRWGVMLRNDFVVDPENTLKGVDIYVKRYVEHPITTHMGGVGARFYLPRSVEPLKWDKPAAADDLPQVSALAMTSEHSWSETQLNQKTVQYDEHEGDLRGSFSLAVAVERGGDQEQLDVQIKPSRMVVFGDSDFVSNKNVLTGGNKDLFMSSINWLLDREELMAIAAKPVEDVQINLTRAQLVRLFWLNVVGIPAVAVVLGLLIWVRRRK